MRFWLLGSANGDQTVWLGAATHDVGIAFRRRGFGFTHVVYSQVDEERSRIVFDLDAIGCVDKVSVYHRAGALRHSRNATGDHLETDGSARSHRAAATISNEKLCTGQETVDMSYVIRASVAASHCLICGTSCRKMDINAKARTALGQVILRAECLGEREPMSCNL